MEMRRNITNFDVEYPKMPIHIIGMDRRNNKESKDCSLVAPKPLAKA